MNVIAFPQQAPAQTGNWQAIELNQIVESVAPAIATGKASGWQTGTTEIGDPQFYLLGPPPDQECVLCISRLGRLYVLEDGGGRILLEHVSLLVLAEQARTFLRSKRARLVARIVLLWCGVRHTFEERVEPVLVETEELLTHFAPQLVALV